MHQAISVLLLVVVAVLLNASPASRMAAAGNWGEAVGSMLFGPLVVFYVLHSLIYGGAVLLRGRLALASYAASRLNYVALAISLLGVVGAAVQRSMPPA